MKVYSIYDAKAEAYSAPMVLPARGLALRGFSDECSKPDSVWGQHPADFTLFELGDWDPNKGLIKFYDAKVPLGTGLDLKNIQ